MTARSDSETQHTARVRELFLRALDQPPMRRDRFLDRATTDGRERTEVESLLSANAAMGGFMAAPDTDAAAPPPDSVPEHRLLRKLGEGGSGTVWLAEEMTTLRRHVAIKFLRRDVFSPAALQRFESERQILASLQHDAIARIYTAGTTPAGCPYFTMEWVDGDRFDSHCDRHRLTLRQRIERFLPVVRAIAHAHQRGVIHGDLKPANLLVCEIDSDPSPKVIDFGIARMVENRRSGTTLGTPDYMSPEQRDGLPLDTRSDVFALGVILSTLLTGVRPDDGGRAPSRMVADLDAETWNDVATRRTTSPNALRRELRGDLDAIVERATANDPERRHASVGEFIADLEAWLARRPVPSRRPGAWTHFLRWFQRHRVATTILALMVLAAMLLALQWVEADAEAEAAGLAKEQAERASRDWNDTSAQVLDYLEEVLLAACPERSGPDVPLRDVLDIAEERLVERLPQPLAEARLRMTLGQVRARLGDTEAALHQIDQALEITRGHPATPPTAVLRLEVERLLLILNQDPFDAEAHTRLAQVAGRLSPTRSPSSWIRAQRNLALVDLRLGHPRRALERLRTVTGRLEETGSPESAQARALWVFHANAESEFGDQQLAKQRLAQIDELAEPNPERDRLFHWRQRLVTAATRYREGELSAAKPVVEDAIEALRAPIHRYSAARSIAFNILGGILRQERDHEGALAAFREQLAILVARRGKGHPSTLTTARNAAMTLTSLGRDSEALVLLDEYQPAADLRTDEIGTSTAWFLVLRSSLMARAGKPRQALANHQPALDCFEREFGPAHHQTIRQRLWRASILIEAGDREKAAVAFERIHTLSRAAHGPSHPTSLLCLGRLAFGLTKISETARARELLCRRLDLALAAHGPTHNATFRAAFDLIGFATDEGESELALATYERFGEALDRALAEKPTPALQAMLKRYRDWPRPVVASKN